METTVHEEFKKEEAEELVRMLAWFPWLGMAEMSYLRDLERASLQVCVLPANHGVEIWLVDR